MSPQGSDAKHADGNSDMSKQNGPAELGDPNAPRPNPFENRFNFRRASLRAAVGLPSASDLPSMASLASVAKAALDNEEGEAAGSSNEGAELMQTQMMEEIERVISGGTIDIDEPLLKPWQQALPKRPSTGAAGLSKMLDASIKPTGRKRLNAQQGIDLLKQAIAKNLSRLQTLYVP